LRYEQLQIVRGNMNNSNYKNYLVQIIEKEFDIILQEESFGLFQMLSSRPKLIDSIFTPFKHKDELVKRIKDLFNLFDNQTQDAYFIPKNSKLMNSEIRTLCESHLASLEYFAKSTDDSHLLGIINKISKIEEDSITKEDLNSSASIVIYENVGDAISNLGYLDDSFSFLRDAYYSIACDYILSFYLTWPQIKHNFENDLFKPYYELYSNGIIVGYNNDMLKYQKREVTAHN
jgi:hypothetical protein